VIVEQTRSNQREFVWTSIRSIEELRAVRVAAMQRFLADFENGKLEGRYPSRPNAAGTRRSDSRRLQNVSRNSRFARNCVDVSGDDERQQVPLSQHIGPESRVVSQLRNAPICNSTPAASNTPPTVRELATRSVSPRARGACSRRRRSLLPRGLPREPACHAVCHAENEGL
jgi:hypothetical protein